MTHDPSKPTNSDRAREIISLWKYEHTHVSTMSDRAVEGLVFFITQALDEAERRGREWPSEDEIESSHNNLCDVDPETLTWNKKIYVGHNVRICHTCFIKLQNKRLLK